MPKFTCNLKKYRQLKELTQEQLAEKVGVRRETIINRYIKNSRYTY